MLVVFFLAFPLAADADEYGTLMFGGDPALPVDDRPAVSSMTMEFP